MVDHMGCLGICVVRDWPITAECFRMDMFFDDHNSGSLGVAKALGLVDNWQTPAKKKNLIAFTRFLSMHLNLSSTSIHNVVLRNFLIRYVPDRIGR